MNAVIERAIEIEQRRKRDLRNGANVSVTPSRIRRIIAYLNREEALEIKLDFIRAQRRQEKAVASAREIPTKPAPFRPWTAR